MASSGSQIFSKISPEMYTALIAKANAAGFALSGSSGTASRFGVEVTWNYAVEAQELTIHCVSAPFFMSVESVNAKIKGLVEEAVG